ncbi:hypothetical protein JCM10212_000072 [Sporobolomyces blumeae]
MQAVMHSNSSSGNALEHWAATNDHSTPSPAHPTPPLTQAGFDTVSSASSSGHHSHEPSLEHSLHLGPTSATSNASGLALPVAAYHTSPRSLDYRTGNPQSSSLRATFNSYAANGEDALESLRRSYSATSDIRGTLEDTRLGSSTSSNEQWTNGQTFIHPSARRESEPSAYAARYHDAPIGGHRGSLPYPLERADSLPIRRLRRAPQPGSPGYSSGAPSLTDGSTSPGTSRGSFIETPYLSASPIVEELAHDGRYGPSQSEGYPFPEMYRPSSRHSISGPSPCPQQHAGYPTQPMEMNRHGKRLSISRDIEGERAYSPRPSSSSFGSLPVPPPYGPHTGLPDPPKSAYDFRPGSARATSPRGGVYDIDDTRQVFLPFFPQHQHQHQPPPRYADSPSLELLPPHDSYDSMKKRRMSAGAQPSPSLGSRREAASTLHLSGLPTPATPAISFDYHQQQQHLQHQHSPAIHQYPSANAIYEQQPRTPTTAPALVRSGSYGLSFTSPAFLDNAPPLLLDSPVGSPRKHSVVHAPVPVSPSIEPPCDELPQPPATSAGGGTAFMDPNYPVDNFSICHRRPPPGDFEVSEKMMPRTQDLRFEEDQYTPLWVRQDGKDKEGWCALCPGNGKWLQLKNSAFWYHRQFQHGISSSSGHYFLPPLETRPAADGAKTEGLCHMCGEYKPYQNHRGSSNSAGKGPTPWFRHAHECHQYFSPKKEARKNMKLARSVN